MHNERWQTRWQKAGSRGDSGRLVFRGRQGEDVASLFEERTTCHNVRNRTLEQQLARFIYSRRYLSLVMCVVLSGGGCTPEGSGPGLLMPSGGTGVALISTSESCPRAPADERFYRDADADGFGTESDFSCGSEEGYVRARGDCDDTDPSIHPGASDPASDGIDQDCGGSPGPEPHVGFSETSASSIRQAIDEASPGTTVWVAPGSYSEGDISFRGRALTLKSTHFAAYTTINAMAKGRVMLFVRNEKAGTVVDGFLLTGGHATSLVGGGGVLIHGASPTLRNCIIAGNSVDAAFASGGGIAMNDAYPQLFDCWIVSNSVSSRGLHRIGLAEVRGGGIYMLRSNPVLTNCLIGTNEAYACSAMGGGVYAEQSCPTFINCTFEHNLTAYDARICGVSDGAGAYLTSSSSATFFNASIRYNLAYGQGGGLSATDSSVSLANCTVAENESYNAGAGIYVDSSMLTVTNTSVMRNEGDIGGLFVTGTSAQVRIRNCILAYNRDYNIFNALEAPGSVSATYSGIYAPPGWNTQNVSIGGGANSVQEPVFLSYDEEGLPDDYHISLESPWIDIGDPTIPDVDGSRSDPGAFGGPGGGSTDGDQDGYYDYFWPGTLDDAPEGFDPTNFDIDDLNATVHGSAEPLVFPLR